jgi:hypothetical protein
MALSHENVEALAPDQSSLDAARKLLKAASWPALASNGTGLIWGECQGSGATPYRVVVSEADAGYKCSCPSRKFPCKHSLALMWLRADGKLTFASATVPAWVSDWVSRRRGPSAATSSTPAEGGSRASIQATGSAVPEIKPDPKAEARAAAARERNRQEREDAVLAGLDDLDLWISDQIDRGLAGFASQSAQTCRVIAQRLVDAKASGLASRLEGLPARLFTLPEAVRPAAAIQELGLLHLLAAAYRRQNEGEYALPPGLKADVRQAIGWSLTREALLADPDAMRARARWRVFAALSEVQADRLRRLETWLWRETDQESPRFAVLIDFVPVATGAASSGYSVGDRIDAELAFYPAAVPLRAQIAQSFSGAESSQDDLAFPDQSLHDAHRSYEQAMLQEPWLDVCPIYMSGARLRRHGSQLFLCDSETKATPIALVLKPAQLSLATPLLSLAKLDAIGLWDGYYLNLCWAQTELGRWVNA